MKLLYSVLIFILAIIVHELGHYLGYKLAKRKPFFQFKWYLIYAECENRLTLTLKQYFSIGLLGISFGLIVISFTNDSIFILTYLLACCIDFSIIFEILSVPKEERDMTLFDKSEKDYFKAKAEFDKNK
jgi:hypothetical protein